MNSKNSASRDNLKMKKQMANVSESRDTLRIKSVKHLGFILGIPIHTLLKLTDDSQKYYREFERDVKGKKRTLVEATGLLKSLQRRILDGLLERLPQFPRSYGGIKGRTIKDNAKIHAKSKFIVKLDIRDFYPSIHNTKVYKFFIKQKCSPDVARILTSLTTYKYFLPLGTSTSPMLADQIIRTIDKRIDGLAKNAGLKYSRYVDDLTLSGNFPLERISRTTIKLLRESGFKAKKEKLIFYGPANDKTERIITGVRIRGGIISAPLGYIKSLEEELKEAIYQSRRNILTRHFKMREHYKGKINYIKWLDPDLGFQLEKLYRKVKWRHIEWAEEKENLVLAEESL